MISRFREFLEGLLATISTAALLVGVPIALAAALGSPITRLTDAFASEVTSSTMQVEAVLLAGLTMVAWLAWAQLVYAIAIELVAYRRGRMARSIAVFPGLQQTAGRLVAGCALLITSFTPTLQLVTPAVAVALPMPYSASDVEGAQDLLKQGNQGPTWANVAQTRANPVAAASYTVKAGDTFWSISEQFLGDGLRWSEVREVNVGRAVADGVVLTAQAEALETGWTLALPADAVVPLEVGDNQAEVPTGRESSDEETTTSPTQNLSASDEVGVASTRTSSRVTVRQGNHFWGMAVEQLTHAWGRIPDDEEVVPYWNQLIDVNRSSLVHPDDPDVIYEDQVFRMPPTPSDPWKPATDVVIDLRNDDLRNDDQRNDDHRNDDQVVELPEGLIAKGIIASGLQNFEGDGAEDADEIDDEADVVIDLRTRAVPLEPHRPSSKPMPSSAPPDASSLPAAVTRSDHGSVSGGDLAASPRPAGSAIANDDVAWGRVILSATGFGLLAASLLQALRRRRRRQWQRRPSSTKPQQAGAQARAFEASLAQVAQPDRLAVAELATRSLGAALPPDPPQVQYVSVADDRLIVSLSRTTAAAGVFEGEATSGLWQLQQVDESLLADLEARRDEVATVPALATLGHDPDTNADVLIDLEHVLRLRVDGPPPAIKSFLQTMAAELAVSSFADDMHVICVGFGENLADLDRIDVVGSIEEAVSLAREQLGRAATPAGEVDSVNLLAARLRDPIEAAPPIIVIVAEDLVAGVGDVRGGAAEAPSVGALLDLALSGIVVIAPGIDSSWRVALSPGQVRVEPLDLTLARHDLNREQFAALGELIEATSPRSENSFVEVEVEVDGEPPVGVDTPTRDDPQAPENEVAVDVELQVLGVVQVLGAAREFSSIRAVDVIAYLAFHRDGANADQLKTWIWPLHSAPSDKAFANVMSRARKGLGTNDDGDPYLTKADTQGIYRLLPSVRTDFDRMEAAVRAATTAEDKSGELAALRDALDLVRGVPFTGGGGSGFLWADNGVRSHVDYTIDEAVHRCADLALELGDLETARWAVFKGLANIPACEQCYQRRFRTAAADGNQAELRSAMANLEAIVSLEADEPEGLSLISADTLALFDELAHGRSAAAG